MTAVYETEHIQKKNKKSTPKTGDNGNAMFLSKVGISNIPAIRFLYRLL